MLRCDQVGYRYPTGALPAVRDVDLHIAPGEFVLLTGPTGCGKSTLLRLVAGLLRRHGQGQIFGRVQVSGRAPGALEPSERAQYIGFVSQVPDDQIVTGTTGDEVAFAMESCGWSAARIDPAVHQALEAVGLPADPDRSTRALSGGQRQRLVVAASLGAGAKLLLLDEPLAQLDPAAAQTLLSRLRTLADAGTAVCMVEHRLPACLPHVHRVVLMEGGCLTGQWGVEEMPLAPLRACGLSLPGLADLSQRLGVQASELDALPTDGLRPPTPSTAPNRGPRLLHAKALRYRWPDADADALCVGEIAAHAGERIAIMGVNGSGKSTLLRCLSGDLAGGQVDAQGRVVDVPQDPDLALFCGTVRAELAHGPAEDRLTSGAIEERVAAAAHALSVADLLDRAPQALSRGQRLRVAVAAALSCRPALLLLDEPTAGQDEGQVERMMRALERHQRDGALLFATHDVGLALRHATRVWVLHDGEIIGDGPPAETLLALPAGLGLEMPALAAWCVARGLPPQSAADLARGLA